MIAADADAPLVSVIVPAYNAVATLTATLQSIRAQTWPNLEIIVVDDGSRDDTAAMVERIAAEDARIRLLRKPNGGVAEARNVGIAACRGDFVAPVDADDLLHPMRIERQMARMVELGPQTGFVYTLSHCIDAADVVTGRRGVPGFEGRVSRAGLMVNFVGNGSALLFRRAALEDVDGYESELRRQGAQGAEDYLIQFLVARRWLVGCVPEALTGYRLVAGTMSGDALKMNRSHLVALDLIEARCPDVPTDALQTARALYYARNAADRAQAGAVLAALADLGAALRRAPVAALDYLLWSRMMRPLARTVRSAIVRSTPTPGVRFGDADYRAPTRRIRTTPLGWLVERLMREEASAATR